MGEERKELTATQQSILYTKRDNPEWSNSEIADSVGCSVSHVSRTLNRWDPKEMDSDGTVPKETESDESESKDPREEIDEFVVPGSDYFAFVVIALVLQVGAIVLLFDSSLVPGLSGLAAGMIGFFMWLAQPVVVFADANDLNRSGAAVQPNRIIWPAVVFFIPVVGPLLYLRKRVAL